MALEWGDMTEYPYRDFPRLEQYHLSEARLHADREALIASLDIEHGGRIAEVGVALGDFSEFLLKTLHPSEFVAFDTFTMHEYPVHWGRSSQEIFGDQNHFEFYQSRLSIFRSCLVTKIGPSQVTLPAYPHAYFDLIYVDGAHDYESVRQDAFAGSLRVKPSGFMIFNDYIMMDHLLGAPYGIVPAVNELLVSGGWEVVGFALQQHMFCDIALRKVAQPLE